MTAPPVPRLSDELSMEYLENQMLLPVELREETVVLATAGQPDPQAVAEIGAHFQKDVELRVHSAEELRDAIRSAYGRADDTAEDLIATLAPLGDEETSEFSTHDLEGLANERPVVRLVNLLISEAAEADASDIHLEATESGVDVRYRIDGVLQQAPSPPSRLRSAMISRLKIMAELDIAERRLPQDGRIRMRLDKRRMDVRVSTLPTLHGESVVLRLLDATRQRHSLGNLGMHESTLQLVRRFTERPQGVFLVTGPTGSGKTTTLYAMLEHLVTGREKVVSVEDPVEYQLPGVSQVPVQEQGGLGFGRALRSILRQDPDVLMVGEMRDPETAQMCIQAAMTGHLVLSTLHTNDAPSALNRLLDLGVPEFLVGGSLKGILAQRLVRKNCQQCAEREAATAQERKRLVEDGVSMPLETVVRGRGCAECRGTGFRGRTGIYELLVIDDEMRALIAQGCGSAKVRRLAAEKGMRSLRADGWRQVGEEITTPEEVLRVAKS